MLKKLVKACAMSLVVSLLLTTLLTTTVSAASTRKNLGYKWAGKYGSVTFYTGFNSTWKTAITSAMTGWNGVKELTTNKTTVPMSFTTSSTAKNKIYSTSNQTWLGKMFPTYSNGTLTAASIAFNSGDYTFTNGASSGKYDIQTIALHELGHAIGIAHCHEISEASCFSKTCSKNVMQPTIGSNMTRRTFQDYDTASKKMIY